MVLTDLVFAAGRDCAGGLAALTVRGVLWAALREPIVQFLLLGALLYGASVLLARQTDPRRIVLTTGEVVRLEQRHVQQFGVRPSSRQLEWLIERHLRDEVLYREGLALGLGEGDEVVRRRIVQKMEFLSEDEGLIAAPTAAELRAFYDAHPERYRSPARVSVTQLYFSPDRSGGEDSARARAARALTRLEAGSEGAVDADSFGEGERLERMDRAGVERMFGRSELATRVFELPAGRWSGPLRSGIGWHLVRVEAQESPRLAPLAEVESELRSDWEQDQRAQRKQEALERLMRGYRIVRENAARAELAAPIVASAGQ